MIHDSPVTARSAPRLVLIATYGAPIWAHIPRTRLQSAGIQAFVFDENIVTMNWLYSVAVGGVKLLVREPDVASALILVRRRPEGIAHGVVTGQADDWPVCPRCRASNAYYERFWRLGVFASWLLFSVPFPFLKMKWVCASCGHQWRERSR